jgi:hypothetical protein
MGRADHVRAATVVHMLAIFKQQAMLMMEHDNRLPLSVC